MNQQLPKSIRVAYLLLSSFDNKQDWRPEFILRETSESPIMTEAIGGKSSLEFPYTLGATAVFAAVMMHHKEFPASLVDEVRSIMEKIRNETVVNGRAIGNP